MAWLAGYTYRKKGGVVATAAGAQTLYQMRLTVGESSGAAGANVHCTEHCEDFPNDIRFTDADGETKHDYWVQSVTGITPNRLATILIKVATIPASGFVDFYMYYGKSGDSGESSGVTTFPFFDDFLGDALDTDKWDYSGTIAVSGSEVTLNEDDWILNKSAYGLGYGAWAKVKADEQDTYFITMRETFANDNERADIYNSDSVYPDDFDRFGLAMAKGGSGDDVQKTGWTDFRNEYYDYRVRRISASKTIFNQSLNEHEYTDSNHISVADLKAGLRVWTPQASTLICDWIFIHKTVSPDPTWGTWESEGILAGTRCYAYIIG